jgi:YYY domain-containing protein
MVHFFAWYLIVTLLGWIIFPLAWRLFPGLADRGYTLARALGLLVWGYLFWMLASLKVIQNDAAGIILALIVVFLLVAWAARKYLFPSPAPITSWIKTNARLIITVEILFFLAFAAWTFVRASNPNIETAGGEKTMELAFINAILHSPTFPPHDPWLSGFSISYYYFGYVLTAMLAKITSTSGGIAHNLMLALVFSLSFIGVYGILYNLLAAWRKHTDLHQLNKPSLGLPLLGPLFMLFISNVAGFLEVLHRRGFGWHNQAGESNLWTKLGALVRPNLEAHNFWTWLDIQHLSSPPAQPYQWTPDRFIWWWQDSRVIQDYDLAGNFTEIIDEFPAFSYLLGDLHPHVLAMPFILMAIAFCINLFMGGWEGETNFRWFTLPIHPVQLIMGGLLLGGLAFLNTWDILPGFALLVGGYVMVRVRQHGWTFNRLWDVFAFGLPLGLIAFLLYLPFFLGFSSQAGGILPNLEYPTRGAHLWVMFGTLLVPILFTLFYFWRGEKIRLNKWVGISLGLGIPLFLWVFSWLLGWVAQLKLPEFAASYMAGIFHPGGVLFSHAGQEAGLHGRPAHHPGSPYPDPGFPDEN